MSTAQVIWAALILAQAIVVSPIFIHVLSKRNQPMSVSPAAQAIVDSLTAAAGELPTALGNASVAVTAQAAEDLAAIQTAAQSLTSAIAAALPAPAPAPTEEVPQ